MQEPRLQSRSQITFLSGRSREPETDIRLRLRRRSRVMHKNLNFLNFAHRSKCVLFSGRSRSRGAGAVEPEPSVFKGPGAGAVKCDSSATPARTMMSDRFLKHWQGERTQMSQMLAEADKIKLQPIQYRYLVFHTVECCCRGTQSFQSKDDIKHMFSETFLTYLICFLMSSSEPTKSLKVLTSARGARSRLVRLTWSDKPVKGKAVRYKIMTEHKDTMISLPRIFPVQLTGILL